MVLDSQPTGSAVEGSAPTESFSFAAAVGVGPSSQGGLAAAKAAPPSLPQGAISETGVLHQWSSQDDFAAAIHSASSIAELEVIDMRRYQPVPLSIFRGMHQGTVRQTTAPSEPRVHVSTEGLAAQPFFGLPLPPPPVAEGPRPILDGQVEEAGAAAHQSKASGSSGPPNKQAVVFADDEVGHGSSARSSARSSSASIRSGAPEGSVAGGGVRVRRKRGQAKKRPSTSRSVSAYRRSSGSKGDEPGRDRERGQGHGQGRGRR